MTQIKTISTTAGLLAALGLSLIPPCLNAGSSTTPWSQIGTKAGADYRGDGLAVSPTAEGARLRCVFQRLEGEATREGLWLTSTVIPPSGTGNDRFRVVAAEVGRVTPCAPGHRTGEMRNLEAGGGAH